MTLRFLLDTSVVSAPIAKAPNRELIRKLDAHGHECAIAAPVWNELTYGCVSGNPLLTWMVRSQRLRASTT